MELLFAIILAFFIGMLLAMLKHPQRKYRRRRRIIRKRDPEGCDPRVVRMVRKCCKDAAQVRPRRR